MYPLVIESPLFPLGQVVATPGALASLTTNQVDIKTLLQRHASGDWGDVCEEDRASNDNALKQGDRLLSSYLLSDACKIWVITEWDRSVTTVLLPEDY